MFYSAGTCLFCQRFIKALKMDYKITATIVVTCLVYFKCSGGIMLRLLSLMLMWVFTVMACMTFFVIVMRVLLLLAATMFVMALIEAHINA